MDENTKKKLILEYVQLVADYMLKPDVVSSKERLMAISEELQLSREEILSEGRRLALETVK